MAILNLTSGIVFLKGWSGTVSGSILTLDTSLSVQRTALATTSTDGVILENTTAATGGATVQISPRLRLRGTAWDTAASETTDFFLENLPATAATPTATLNFGYSLNGAAATTPMTLTSAGVLGLAGPINFTAKGTRTAPIISFADADTGFYAPVTAGNSIDVSTGSTAMARFDNSTNSNGLTLGAGIPVQWATTNLNAGSAASFFVDLKGSGAAGGLVVGPSNATTGNGQQYGLTNMLTELTTIAAAATTDTAIQMPAGAVILGVSVRVTTVIPTAATFTVGDSGSAARFSTAAVSTAATSTDAGTKAGAYYNASALSIRITPNLTPADNTGRVRVVIWYYTLTPPTS